MAKSLMKLNRNTFVDRRVNEYEKLPELNIRLETIDSILLLLDSEEEMVLINALKHIVEYVRKNNANVSLLQEKQVLNLLLQREFYRTNDNVYVRRLSLFLGSFIIENVNRLVDLEGSLLCQVVNLSLLYYLKEEDGFCCEYLSVMLNKCMDDPQCATTLLGDSAFISKYFSLITGSSNPDVLLHSLELLYKILQVQSSEEKQNFVTLASFPANRLLCELCCEFIEIRTAALKVIQSLVLMPSANNILHEDPMASFLLEQLTKMFCETLVTEELGLLVEVLVAALEHESMINLFFELNLFDKYLSRLSDGNLDADTICLALWVFTACAKSAKSVPRLVSADITEKLLECLLTGDGKPAEHILLGLNRLMKSPVASKRIIDSYDGGLLQRILKLLAFKDAKIKSREQAANLLQNLLSYAFHKTCGMILSLNFVGILADVFGQKPEDRSIDLLLSLLNVIEMMAANADYRAIICAHSSLITHLGVLLKNSFLTAILVTHIFRCLCSLVVEEGVHEQLLKTNLCSSIKRALQSPSNQVKTAVTNFIMQTTRFPTFVVAYKASNLLEALFLYQKHAFCVPTWKPAIESLLAKSLTMKFCIRNSLGFTDSTVGIDFKVSKRKFEDFRVFKCILSEDVSPLQPVIVVNFNRPADPEDLVVKVPVSCTTVPAGKNSPEEEWCYCRAPGDEYLPAYLDEVNSILESENLAVNPSKIQKGIDFDNLARRAAVIAQVVQRALGNDLKTLDLNGSEECSTFTVNCHLKDLCKELHCTFIPLGRIRSGCKFERAILFKALADQIGLPCTLQRSVDGRILFNELPLPLELDQDIHCDKKTMSFMPWRMLRPTHIVDLMYNVGELYPIQSRQAMQYLRLY